MSAGKAVRPKADSPFFCEFTAGGDTGNGLPRSKVASQLVFCALTASSASPSLLNARDRPVRGQHRCRPSRSSIGHFSKETGKLNHGLKGSNGLPKRSRPTLIQTGLLALRARTPPEPNPLRGHEPYKLAGTLNLVLLGFRQPCRVDRHQASAYRRRQWRPLQRAVLITYTGPTRR